MIWLNWFKLKHKILTKSFYIYKSQWKTWRNVKFLTTYYQTNSEILGGCRCSINHKISSFYRNERCKKVNENCPIGSHKKYRTNYFYIFNIAYTPVSLKSFSFHSFKSIKRYHYDFFVVIHLATTKVSFL